MNRHRGISNSDDIIDSRDVIKRIEDLEGELTDGHKEATTTDCENCEDGYLDNPADGPKVECETCKGEGEITAADAPTLAQWIEATAADDSHAMQDEATEYRALKKLADEAEGYAADWHHGETLIRDSYFETYARELAEEIGAVNAKASWPNDCIDWEAAAEALQQDYTSVSFDGVEYWIR